VEHVREVVLDRRLEVTVTDSTAGLDRARRRHDGFRYGTAGGQGEGERGQGRDRRGRIWVIGGQVDASPKRGARHGQVAPRLGNETDEALRHPGEMRVADAAGHLARL